MPAGGRLGCILGTFFRQVSCVGDSPAIASARDIFHEIHEMILLQTRTSSKVRGITKMQESCTTAYNFSYFGLDKLFGNTVSPLQYVNDF